MAHFRFTCVSQEQEDGDNSNDIEATDTSYDESIDQDSTEKDTLDEQKVTNIACNLCNQFFTNQLHLRRHKVSVHKVTKICEICGYYSKSRSINAHIRQYHPGVDIYKCELCEASFNRFYDLSRHRKTKHTPEEIRTARGIIKYKKIKFAKEVSSARTPSAKSENQKLSLCCEEKQKTSTKSEKLKQMFHCEKCPKVFKSFKGLAIHGSFHAEKYQSGCALCKKIFYTSRDALSHICTHNGGLSMDVLSLSCVKSGILPNYCAKCKAVLLSPLDVKYHDCTMNKHNFDNDCFICGVCRASYPTQKHLLGHMGLHTGEATVECTLCRVGFTSADSLEKHACLGPVRKNLARFHFAKT